MLALEGLLEGKLDKYSKVFEGGTSAPSPAVLNEKRFSVSKKGVNGEYFSASMRIPHVKTSKTFADIQLAVVGAFDQDWESSTKCTASNAIYDNNKS